MTLLRSIGLVALFDLYESLRSRRAIALLSLYVIAATGASAVFVKMVRAARDKLGPESTAAATAVFQSDEFIRDVGKLLGNVEIARALVSTPPLALFYGWLAMFFIPVLIVLTSSETIATERASGAARFVLFRVDRLSWALGKLLGQLFLMAVGVGLGATASYALGLLYMPGFVPWETAWWMLRLTGRACCYGFAYLGLAFWASQWARTAARARWFGLVLLVGCWLAGSLLKLPAITERAETLATAVLRLLPGTYQLPLWDPDIVTRLTAMGALLLLGTAFFVVGYLRFARQDA